MARGPIDLPPEREVRCDCLVSFHRPVLRDHTGVNRRVSGCLRCGEVSVTDSIVEEPHPHDVRCVANRLLEVDPTALAWLAAWPRVGGPAWEWRDPYFLSATTRVGDEKALATLEDRARREQRSLAPHERLRLVGVPIGAPPTLPGGLAAFELAWREAAIHGSTTPTEAAP